MILECQLEKELLIDLLVDDQRSQIFWKRVDEQAAAIQSSSCKPNDKSKEYFGLNGELINRLRPDLENNTQESEWPSASASQPCPLAICFHASRFRSVCGIAR